jgi:hypothetical protein
VKDRIFHWAKLHELGDWLACGWVFAATNAPMHHHDYSFMMEWLCDCKMVRPVR